MNSIFYIYQQPNPLEKFVYGSGLKRKSTLKSEIILCSDTVTPISVVMDLYAQINPPLLSPHVLKQNGDKNSLIVIDTMEQVSPTSAYYTYKSENFHIWKKCNSNKRHILVQKLTELKSWQLGRPLEPDEFEIIENIVKTDYFEVKCEKKVYLGFTAYIYDSNTKMQKLYAPTIFSNAIYDCYDFHTLTPNCGSISGQTYHQLKLASSWNTSMPDKVQIKLSDKDKSWEEFTTGYIEGRNLRFELPSYNGIWNSEDKNRLIELEVMDKFEGLPKGAIKFVYT